MPKLERRGVVLNYQLDGADNLPVLLLSNSLGTDLSMWDPQMNAFSQKFRVLRYDMRGHGGSSVPKGPYTIEDMGRDVLALLDGLGHSRVNFCGLSLGGMIGQWLAIHAPERIHSLILANTAAKIGTIDDWNERIEQVRSKGMAAVVPAVLERWYTPEFRNRHSETVATTCSMLEAMNVEGYMASCAAVRDMDFRGAIGTIASSTMIVYGEQDPVTPPEAAQFMSNKIVGSSLIGLRAAHLSNVEMPQEFTDRVLAFLKTPNS